MSTLTMQRNNLWEVTSRTIVYAAIGAALYGILLVAQLPIPGSTVSVRPAFALVPFFGYAFGPIVGFFVGGDLRQRAIGGAIAGAIGVVIGFMFVFTDVILQGVTVGATLTLYIQVVIGDLIGTIILVPILVYAWEPVKAQLGR